MVMAKKIVQPASWFAASSHECLCINLTESKPKQVAEGHSAITLTAKTKSAAH